MMETRWYSFGTAKFLIRPFDVSLILFLRDRVQAGEMDEEMAMKQLFKDCLLGWKGIAEDSILPRSKKMAALFGDAEIRNFVIGKAFKALEVEVLETERVVAIVQEWRSLTGSLKS